MWGTGGASEKEAVAAVVVVAVLSNARPRRINASRERDKPAVVPVRKADGDLPLLFRPKYGP